MIMRKKMALRNISCEEVALFDKNTFGSYSFSKEVRRVGKIIKTKKPSLLIGHSLGAYILNQLPISCPLVLIEPSQEISKIILPNTKMERGRYVYNDGIRKLFLSSSFMRSIKRSPSMQKVAYSIQSKHILIIGAGKGGHRIAERYYRALPNACYRLLLGADHNFSRTKDVQKLVLIIETWLDVIASSQREDVHSNYA